MDRERDLLPGPSPTSTCIRSESVVGLRAPPLLGDAVGESVVIGGSVIAPPVPDSVPLNSEGNILKDKCSRFSGKHVRARALQ